MRGFRDPISFVMSHREKDFDKYNFYGDRQKVDLCNVSKWTRCEKCREPIEDLTKEQNELV